jgi:23S rRNA (uracil1939-C5)-methyltransferase
MVPVMNSPTLTYEISVTTFVYGGECLGRLPDGRAVFVPLTLPGERVRVVLTEEKRRFARAELLEVVEASDQRIRPRCPHFTTCGGCHYQHMPYEAQLAAKRDILVDQLERIGGIENPPVFETVPSPQPFNYRNHIQFQLSPLGHLGFFKHASDQVLEIQECHLPQDPINVVWPQLELEAIPGMERVGFRLGSDDDLMIIFQGSQSSVPEFSVEDINLSAVHLGPFGRQVLAGSDHLQLQVIDREFRVSADSFFQVNIPVAERLVEHILAQIDIDRNSQVLDVYAGVGLFSGFIARQVAQVVAVESAESSCADFVVNLDEFDNTELYQAQAELVLPELDLQPDLILLDPPRAGLDVKVVDALVRMGPDTIVYVSCDPATMARDAKRLVKGGYRLENITPFDMFPQTYHLESVGIWCRVQS